MGMHKEPPLNVEGSLNTTKDEATTIKLILGWDVGDRS